MRRLILIRHAPAEAAGPDGDDVHRPLSPRGEKAAVRLAAVLPKSGPKPDLIVSSPADRALETAHIFARRWGFDIRKILVVESVYQGHPLAEMQALVRDLDDRRRTVVLVGHNPNLCDLAGWFLKRRGLMIPKGAVLTLEFASESWKECGPADAVFKSLDIPHGELKALKWAKPLRRALTARLAGSAQAMLKAMNPEAAQGLRRDVKEGLKKMVQRFVKSADPVRLTDPAWLAELDLPAVAVKAAARPARKKAAARPRKSGPRPADV